MPGAIGEKVLAQVKGLTEYAGGNYGQVSVAAPGSGSGTAVPAIGLDQLHGTRVPDPARGPGPGRAA